MKHNKGTKGGSYLCSENYCTGYRPSAQVDGSCYPLN